MTSKAPSSVSVKEVLFYVVFGRRCGAGPQNILHLACIISIFVLLLSKKSGGVTMDTKSYYLNFIHLTNAIIKGQHISPIDLFHFENYGEPIDDYILAHLSLSYLIASEDIHEKMLPEAIRQAFMNYSQDKNNCCDPNNYINIDFLQKYLREFIDEGDKSGQSILKKEMFSRDAFLKNLEVIICTITEYIANNTSDAYNSKYALILQAYFPCIIFSFITNYRNSLNDSICKTTKSMDNNRAVNHVIKSLSHPSANISVSGKKVREVSDNFNIIVKAFKYTVLYNTILQSCKRLNFTLAFIWFERNVGAYQFYFKCDEYANSINCICKYQAHDNTLKINIEKSIAISDALISGYKLDDDVIVHTLACLAPEENHSFFTSFCNKFSNTTSFKTIINDYIDIFDGKPTKHSLQKEMLHLLNKNQGDEVSHRFSATLINYIFFNDIWYRENFAVSNPKYLFRCKSIRSRLYEMNDVVFNLWLVDKNVNCPPDFEKIAYSTDLDLLYPLAPDTINTVNIPECIISVKEAKSVFINFKKSPSKNGMFHLKQADFTGLFVETEPDSIDPLFRHSAWTELFYYINSIPENQPVSFGLKYYLDHPNMQTSIGSQNIITSLTNWTPDAANVSTVRDQKASMMIYWETINKSMRNYIGECSGDNYSDNCSVSVSAQCGAAYKYARPEQEYAREAYMQHLRKYSALNDSISGFDKLTQVINAAYTDEISTDYRNSHMMDIYYPFGAKKDLYSVIVTINGESWFYNNKDSYGLYGKYLADKGFAVVNFNYRLAPKYKYPCGFIDVCCLMHYISANAEKYKLDMEHFYIIGNSTGAQLASQYAILATNSEYKALFSETLKLKTPIPKKIALNCGIYEFKENTPYLDWYMPTKMPPSLKASAENALKYINKAFPKTYIAVNVNDTLCSASEVMVEKLKDLKIPYVFRQYGLLDESVTNDFWFDVTSEAGKICSNEEINFFITDY